MYTVFQFNEMAVMVLCLTVAVALAVGQVDGLADSCYPPLGCFSNNAPWNTWTRPVPAPKSPQYLDTRYYLYTRSSANRYLINNPSVGEYNVDGSDFDSSRPTIFVVHGWNGNSSDNFATGMRDAALAKSDANVIVVDWSKGASDGTYFNAVSNTRIAAATTVALVRYLNTAKGVNVAKVHFIGFSLGAQVSGYVGKAFNPKIGRITALDAAQPAFENCDKAVRLDVADAIYIDAIHTDARPTFPTFGFGYIQPIGHSDFYVNGGWGQPNCGIVVAPFNDLNSFGNAVFTSISDVLTCRHNRAVELFVSSATLPNCRFWGHQIDAWGRTAILLSGSSLTWPANHCNGATCSEMGFDSIHYPARGSFDVKTSTTSPYCLSDPTSNSAMASSYIP